MVGGNLVEIVLKISELRDWMERLPGPRSPMTQAAIMSVATIQEALDQGKIVEFGECSLRWAMRNLGGRPPGPSDN